VSGWERAPHTTRADGTDGALGGYPWRRHVATGLASPTYEAQDGRARGAAPTQAEHSQELHHPKEGKREGKGEGWGKGKAQERGSGLRLRVRVSRRSTARNSHHPQKGWG